MSEAVTDIIVSRAQVPEGLRSMVVWSVVAHAVVLGALLFVPQGGDPPAPKTIMTISLGGTPGPRSGGMTQAGGRTVQAPPQPEPVKRAEAPPAATKPAMTLPDPKAPVRPPRPQVDTGPRSSASRTPTTGEQPNEGAPGATARVRGQGFGLASGGGGAGGPVTLDVSNFCCPEYLELMVQAIQRNWSASQGVVGTTTMMFTIQRNGEITMAQVERSSGFVVLDTAAQRALALARLQPLPGAFPNPSLTVHLRFEYQR